MANHRSYNAYRGYRDKLSQLSFQAKDDNEQREFLWALLETVQYELNADYHKRIPCVSALERLTQVQVLLVDQIGKVDLKDYQRVFEHLHVAKEAITDYCGDKMVAA